MIILVIKACIKQVLRLPIFVGEVCDLAGKFKWDLTEA
jgi:hypothetical protein